MIISDSGSSNGRTLHFDCDNAGSKPAPETNLKGEIKMNNEKRIQAELAWAWFEDNYYLDEGLGDNNKMSQFEDCINTMDDESLAGIAGIDWDDDNAECEVADLRVYLDHSFINYWDEVAREDVAYPQIFEGGKQ